VTNSKLYLAPRILHHFVVSFQGSPWTPHLKGRSLHFPPILNKIPSIQNLNETTGPTDSNSDQNFSSRDIIMFQQFLF
jgi:hypothetical protein